MNLTEVIADEDLRALSAGGHCGQTTLDRDVPRMAEELLALRAFVDELRDALDLVHDYRVAGVLFDALEDLDSRLSGIDPR